MRTTRKKLLTILLCLTLTVSLCGCGALPGLSRPVSGIAIAIDPAEPSQIAIDWASTTLSLEHTDVTMTSDGALTITIRLLPSQK